MQALPTKEVSHTIEFCTNWYFCLLWHHSGIHRWSSKIKTPFFKANAQQPIVLFNCCEQFSGNLSKYFCAMLDPQTWDKKTFVTSCKITNYYQPNTNLPVFSPVWLVRHISIWKKKLTIIWCAPWSQQDAFWPMCQYSHENSSSAKGYAPICSGMQ